MIKKWLDIKSPVNVRSCTDQVDWIKFSLFLFSSDWMLHMFHLMLWIEFLWGSTHTRMSSSCFLSSPSFCSLEIHVRRQRIVSLKLNRKNQLTRILSIISWPTFVGQTRFPSDMSSGSLSWRSPCGGCTQTWAESQGCLSGSVCGKEEERRACRRRGIFGFTIQKCGQFTSDWWCVTLRRVLAKVAASWRWHQGASVWAMWVGWLCFFLYTVAKRTVRKKKQ